MSGEDPDDIPRMLSPEALDALGPQEMFTRLATAVGIGRLAIAGMGVCNAQRQLAIAMLEIIRNNRKGAVQEIQEAMKDIKAAQQGFEQAAEIQDRLSNATD